MKSMGDMPAGFVPERCGLGPHAHFGITLHQWYVGQALAGVLSDGDVVHKTKAVGFAIKCADEVIRQLEEREKGGRVAVNALHP